MPPSTILPSQYGRKSRLQGKLSGQIRFITRRQCGSTVRIFNEWQYFHHTYQKRYRMVRGVEHEVRQASQSFSATVTVSLRRFRPRTIRAVCSFDARTMEEFFLRRDLRASSRFSTPRPDAASRTRALQPPAHTFLQHAQHFQRRVREGYLTLTAKQPRWATRRSPQGIHSDSLGCLAPIARPSPSQHKPPVRH